MRKFREVIFTLTAAAAIFGWLSAASPCYGAESRGHGGGSTFVTLGLELGVMLDLGLRAGFEYRSPAGPGVAVAAGIDLLPLFRFGRSGALDLALGVPTAMWGAPLGSGIYATIGGAARLRFELGSRWSLLVRAGAGNLFNLDSGGFHAGADTDLKTSFSPDLEIGAAFRL